MTVHNGDNDTGCIGGILVIFLVVFICGSILHIYNGRYYGHNGYHFAWKDLDRINTVVADTNKDGITTRQESEEYRKRHLIKHRLTVREGREQVYNQDGKPISAIEFSKSFTPKQTHQ